MNSKPSNKEGKKIKKLEIGLLISIIVLAILFRLYFNPMDIDDAYISYRYARNIANGEGYNYNPGLTPVLGTTSPLHTLILAFFNYIGMDIVLISNVLGLIFALISCILVFLILKEYGYPKAGLLAAFILAVINDFVVYTMNGMETSMYVMLILLSVYLFIKKRPYLCTIAAAITALARFEGIILGFTILIVYLIIFKKLPWKQIALFIIIIAPWVIFAIFYFGSPIPQTFIAKRIQGQLSAIPFYVRLFGFFYDEPYLILLPLAILGLAVSYYKKVARVLLLWAVIYTAAYTILNLEAYAWYFIPLVPVFAMLSALGISKIASVIMDKDSKFFDAEFKKKAFVYIFVIIIVLAVIGSSLLGIRHYLMKVDFNWHTYREMSSWLDENTPKNSSIYTGAFGYVGYYTGRTIIDPAFLVMKIPENLKGNIKSSYGGLIPEIMDLYEPEYTYKKSLTLEPFELPQILKEDYTQIYNVTFYSWFETDDLRFKTRYGWNWVVFKRNPK